MKELYLYKQLKPCPFCGCPPKELSVSTELTSEIMPINWWSCTNVKIFKISCRCGCTFEKRVLFFEEFVKSWNNRNNN